MHCNTFMVVCLALILLGAGGLAVAEEQGEIKYEDAVAIEWLDQNGKELNRSAEMNVEATPEEFAAWKRQIPLGKTYIVNPESRLRPYRVMAGTIPAAWLAGTPAETPSWQDEIRPGEFYVFQIGVFALRQDLHEVAICLSDLENENGMIIAATEMTCFNAEGVDIYGQNFTKPVNIRQDCFQPLWFGVQIPREATGSYHGRVVLSPANGLTTEIPLQLTVKGTPVEEDGVSRDEALSRLKWLNSRIAQDNEVTRPYTPLRRNGLALRILGHELEIGENGLPCAITTFYQGSNQTIGETGRPILVAPMSFLTVLSGEVSDIAWQPVELVEENPSRCAWRARGEATEFSVQVDGSLEYDGFLEFQMTIDGRRKCVLDDVRLEIPYTSDMSQYMMGMNWRGGRRPESYSWSWDVNHRGQDAIWLGGVNGGISVRLTGPETVSRQVNVYYQFGPLRRPEGWGNFGRGGVRVELAKEGTCLTAFCGRRALTTGQRLAFGLQMNLTPVKPLDNHNLFGVRFYQGSFSVSDAQALGANYVISHHGTYGNEWINYPLLSRNVALIARQMEELHAAGLQGKLYYTTRETSQQAAELLAVAALDGEILFPGPGPDTRTVILPNGPKNWQIDNLRRNFLPGWTFTLSEGEFAGILDSAVMPNADSRWDNFYLEGLNYLVHKAKIDGIYIDDTLNGRISLRRARKILERNRPSPNIDLHSWNHFNEMAGWESCLVLYLPILPYLDNLWIGEARNYDFPPDYWLVEVSGIPFGVPSQMLQDGGQPWRGMLFGMTARGGAAARCDVSALWRYWDEVGMTDARMIGFWELNSPVHTSNPLVPATVYRLKDKVLVAIANWSDRPQLVELFVDYAALGIPAESHQWRIPAIGDFQNEVGVEADGAIQVPAGKGYLLEIE